MFKFLLRLNDFALANELPYVYAFLSTMPQNLYSIFFRNYNCNRSLSVYKARQKKFQKYQNFTTSIPVL